MDFPTESRKWGTLTGRGTGPGRAVRPGAASRPGPARCPGAASARPRPLWLIDLPVVLVAVVRGSSYLAAKELATTATVIALLLLRFVVAAPVMAVVSCQTS
ncbi:hypothetical protein [Streptomyces lydicus]|uniref:hypothetical protein n=1 Tax=Streptomyces lydicus TaxID=47763 RepID=UPI001012B487